MSILRESGFRTQVGVGVTEALLVLGIDSLAHVCGEAGVSPGEPPLDEFLGDGVAIEEAGEDSLAEQTQQERGVPPGRGDEWAVCGR
jgi:hypothetical protein